MEANAVLSHSLDDCDDVHFSKNELRKQNGGAAQFDHLTVRADSRYKGSGNCNPRRLWSPFGTLLSRRSRLLNAKTAVTIFNREKQKPIFQNAPFSTVVKLPLDAHSTELPLRQAGGSQGSSPAPVPVCP